MPVSSAPPTETQGSASNLLEITVTELAQAVKRTVETNFDRVRVRGELGRVIVAKSGHLYADLKDAGACLNLVMWKGSVGSLRFKPEEGLEVVAEGRLSTFPGKSNYQLIADRMEPAGAGALMALLEERKKKLAAEGLFDAARKKPIPYLPSVIGIVTSPTGAVIRDILHRLSDRFPRRVILWPVVVQGEQAAAQVTAAIEGFNALAPGGAVPRPDLLIVARGGGSIEDLWSFNEEVVVRAAAASGIPLISAVGHETDTTLIDFASDRRAPTPTAAAEMAVPVRAELVERTETLQARLAGALVRGVERRRTELRAASGRLPRPEAILSLPQQRFDRAGEKLAAALIANSRAAQARLDRVAARLRPETLRMETVRAGNRLDEFAARMKPAWARAQQARLAELAAAARVLETLSHKSVLARGFALVTGADGHVVRRAADTSAGDSVRLNFTDGAADAMIGSGGAVPPGGGTRKRSKAGGGQGSLF